MTKPYEIIHSEECAYAQVQNFVSAKQYFVISENGNRYLLVKLRNERKEKLTGVTLRIEQFASSGVKLSADSVHLGGLEGFAHRSLIIKQKLPVASNCFSCRITVSKAEFGKMQYCASDLKTPVYRLDDTESQSTFDDEPAEKLGGESIQVAQRSMKMPMLIMLISLLVLAIAVGGIMLQTCRFISTQDAFLHGGVYYTFENGDKSDGSNLIVTGYRGNSRSVAIPAKIEGHPVISIADEAFAGNKYLREVTLRGDVYIGKSAFKNCTALGSITLDNISVIDDEAFSGCSSLKSVSLKNITSIGESAFGGCVSLESVSVQYGEQPIVLGKRAFSDCLNLLSVDIGCPLQYGEDKDGRAYFENCSSVRELSLVNYECYGKSELSVRSLFGDGSLGSLSLQTLSIDVLDVIGEQFCEGLPLKEVHLGYIEDLSVGKAAFKNCADLSEFDVYDKMTSVGESAFENSGITSFDGSALNTIGERAFAGSKLKSFALNNNSRLKSLPSAAFEDCESLTEIYIPDGITSIGTGAFKDCENLAKVTFAVGNTLRKLEYDVFNGCRRLSAIILPNTVTEIGERAFMQCRSLSSFKFPTSLVTLGEYSFSGTGFSRMEIPQTLTKLERGVFSSCDLLKSVTIGDNIEEIALGAFEDCNALEEMTLSFVGGSETSKRYLSHLFGAENYKDGASFVPLSLKKVTVNNITSLPRFAFYDCKGLKTAIFPEGLEGVAAYAFYGCSALEDFDFDTVTAIGEYAFCGVGFTNLTIPDNVATIGCGALAECDNLIDLTLPFVGYNMLTNRYLSYIFGAIDYAESNKVPTSLGRVTVTVSTLADAYAFYGCENIEEITFIGGLRSVGNYAFYDCRALESIELDENVRSISRYAFYGCESLTAPLLPSGLTTIEDYAFSGCVTMTEPLLPSELATIGMGAFSGCSSFTHIDIPDSVAFIGLGAYEGCENITEATLPFIGSERTGGNSYLAHIFGGESPTDNYVVPTSLQKLTVTGGAGTEIADVAVANCTSIREVVLGESVYGIGAQAFLGCTRLRKLTVPSTVSYISSEAFYNCYMLYEVYNFSDLTLIVGDAGNGYAAYYALAVHNSAEDRLHKVTGGGYEFVLSNSAWYLTGYPEGSTKLKLPESYEDELDSITSYRIFSRLFYRDEKITEITIPDSVTAIGSYALSECKNLTTVRLPKAVESLPEGLFAYDESLEKPTISTSFGSIGKDAFRDCKLIKEFVLSPDCASIGDYAFYGCYALEFFTANDNCESIGEFAFGYCHKLREFDMPKAAKSVDDYAFYDCYTIKKITLPENLVYIGDYAFYGCEKLYEVFNYSSGIGKVTVGSSGNGYVAAYARAVHTSPDEAFDSFIENDLHFIKFYEGWSLIDYYGNDSDIVLGTFFNGSQAVNSYTIAYRAFMEKPEIRRITITAGSVALESQAVINCSYLEKVEATVSDITFESNAIIGCASVRFITVNASHSAIIRSGAFEGVFMPEKVDITGGNLTIETGAFSVDVGQLLFDGDNCFIKDNAFDGVLWNVEIKARESAALGSAAFGGYGVGLQTISIEADELTFSKDTFGGSRALLSLSLSAKDIDITSGALSGCDNLQSVTLAAADSIIIGDSALSGCGSLQKFTANGTNITAGDSAFNFCAALQEMSLTASGDLSVGKNAFASCYVLASANLQANGKSELGDGVFTGCGNLESVTLPSTLTSIPDSAFYGCLSLRKITLPSGIKSIGGEAFRECTKLTTINFPTQLERIGTAAFYRCSALGSLPLSDTLLREIGDFAFYRCSNVTTLSLPHGLENIGNSAFAYCTSLQIHEIDAPYATIGSFAFGGCELGGSLSISAYAIGSRAFENCAAINSLKLEYVTSIDEAAFSGCRYLRQLSLPNTLASIGASAFYDCNSLETLEIPSSVTKIGESAFSGCYNLTSLSPLTSVTSLGSSAFSGCMLLEKIELGDGLTSVPAYAFYSCSSLKELTLPRNLKSIGSNAFAYASSLSYIELPATLTSIDYDAFGNANTLFVVYNKSNLNIQCGDSGYGRVAERALLVTSDPTMTKAAYVEQDGLRFVGIPSGANTKQWYLYDWSDIDTRLVLPQSIKDGSTTVSEYAVLSGAFESFVIYELVIPKSVTLLQSCSFWFVYDVYYEGTSAQWSKIFVESLWDGNSIVNYYNLYFYSDCIHEGENKWTYIDGEISRELTELKETVVREASCTQTGIIRLICEHCDHVEEYYVDMLEHDYDENGVCNNCGDKKEKTEEETEQQPAIVSDKGREENA